MELDSGEVVKIDDGLRNEAIIISDLFNCDEFDALELVITGNNYYRSFLSKYLVSWLRSDSVNNS